MANYMPEVAKMLGVELGEEFEIKMPNSSCYANAMFTDNGLSITDHNVFNAITWQPYVLGHLLNGNYTVKRKPWKPNINDTFYFVDEQGYTYCDHWCDDSIELTLYKIGNCYRTQEEAEANSAKWIEFYKSDEVLEI